MTNSQTLPSWLRPMRRQDREILAHDHLWQILQRADVCRVALCDDQWPYIVPMNFGCWDGKLYFHCASEGMKLDLLHANPNVCFEAEIDVQVAPGENSCNWSVRFQSVIGFGRLSIVTDPAEKRIGLEALLAHYTKGERTRASGHDTALPSHLSSDMIVLRVDVHLLTGKGSDDE